MTRGKKDESLLTLKKNPLLRITFLLSRRMYLKEKLRASHFIIQESEVEMFSTGTLKNTSAGRIFEALEFTLVQTKIILSLKPSISLKTLAKQKE